MNNARILKCDVCGEAKGSMTADSKGHVICDDCQRLPRTDDSKLRQDGDIVRGAERLDG